MNLFRQIVPILREKNIKIHYYCPKQYHMQLCEFAPPFDALEIHAMCDLDGDAIFDKGLSPGWFSPLLELHVKNEKLHFNKNHVYFEHLYEEFYEHFMKTYFGYALPRTQFINPLPLNLLERYYSLPEIYKNIDILFINPPRIWDKFIIRAIKTGCKVAITTPLVHSSSRTNARVSCITGGAVDVAAISTHSLFIVAFMRDALTSVCFNENTLNYARACYIGVGANERLEFSHEKIRVFCAQKIRDLAPLL